MAPDIFFCTAGRFLDGKIRQMELKRAVGDAIASAEVFMDYPFLFQEHPAYNGLGIVLYGLPGLLPELFTWVRCIPTSQRGVVIFVF